MTNTRLRFGLMLPLLIIFSAEGVAGQYRRQAEELPPIFGVSLSAGMLLGYEETLTPVETPDPADERRGVRTVDPMPAVAIAARYGRGLAVYGNVTLGFGSDAELSGTHPLTGTELSGTTELGMLRIGSVGLSFAPLPDLLGLRLEIGPAWLDMGDGGSYLGLRIAGAATFLELGDRLGVLLAWDGYFAGGQHDRDRIEHQIRGGMVSGVRLGAEVVF